MSIHVSQAPTTPGTPTSSAPRAVAAVAAVLFAITLFLTVASVNVPHDASDGELLTWWRDGGHLSSTIASELFSISSAVSFAVVLNHLGTLFATTAMTQWTAFARSMAAAFTALLLVTSALRAVIGHMVQVYDDPTPGIDVLRYSTALDYTLLGTATMTTLALTMVAASVVVMRTGVLGTWVGYVGVGCAAIILAAVAVMMGAFAIPAALLWAICLAVAIWRQPAA